MIIRETKIQECWCDNCSSGQMGKIHDLFMLNKDLSLNPVGIKIKCDSCGVENTVEDILIVMPTSYIIHSEKDCSKQKSNQELKKWLEK